MDGVSFSLVYARPPPAQPPAPGPPPTPLNRMTTEAPPADDRSEKPQKPTQNPKKRKIARWVFAGLALLVGVTFIAASGAKERLKAKYPPVGQMVDMGGYKMHLHCQGQGGPPVIFESGFGDFSLVWDVV